MINSNEVLKIVKDVNPAVNKGDNLITSGVYNSIEIVTLVVRLEDEFHIRISPLDINVDNFNSVDSITDLVNNYVDNGEGMETSGIAIEFDIGGASDELDEINIYEEEEKNEVNFRAVEINVDGLGTLNQTDEAYAAIDSEFKFPNNPKCVLDFLENAANQIPSKIALKDYYGNQMSFGAILQKTKAIGTYLRNKYKCSKRPFVILERRNVNSILMFLGVIWSGNYYVALDEDIPLDRIKMMLDIVSPEGVLWDYNATNDAIFDLDVDLNIYDEMIEEAVDEDALQNIRKGYSYEDPLFGVFTSGTTGTPKCIIKSHGAMVDFIINYVSLFDFNHSDRLGSKLSLMFDAITKDIYTVLYCGAELFIMPRGAALPPDDAKLIEKNRITAVVWTPSLLRNFAQLHILESMNMPSLKKILFVGEALPAKYMNYWLTHKADATYVNLYGTSEMTGNCLYQKVESKIETDIVPLNKVFPGYDVWLIDDDGNRLNDNGSVGEICVAGKMLCVEQIGDNASSASPFDSDHVYHTGDIVQINGKGEYVFLARKDYCFKHAGHRISPGEIEDVLTRLEFVDLAVCLFDSVRQQIVLIWQGDESRTEEMYSFANVALLHHLLPGKYIHMNSIPLNSNGKIDKNRLMNWITDTEGKCDIEMK